MLVVLRLGLFTFIIYILSLMLSLAKAVKLWNNYSIRSNWMSELGITTKHSAKTFNFCISVFGLLSLFLIFNIYALVPKSNLGYMFLLFMSFISICTFFVGVFPMDTKPNSHLLASAGTFFSVLISSFLCIYLIFTKDMFPKGVIVINILTVIIIPFYAFSAMYEHSAKNDFQKFLVKNKGLWEWSTFLLACLWNLMISVLVLFRIIL